jgi:hypothetical protein
VKYSLIILKIKKRTGELNEAGECTRYKLQRSVLSTKTTKQVKYSRLVYITAGLALQSKKENRQK